MSYNRRRGGAEYVLFRGAKLTIRRSQHNLALDLALDVAKMDNLFCKWRVFRQRFENTERAGIVV